VNLSTVSCKLFRDNSFDSGARCQLDIFLQLYEVAFVIKDMCEQFDGARGISGVMHLYPGSRATFGKPRHLVHSNLHRWSTKPATSGG